MLKPDATDLDFVARTVMAEAEGESYEGKVAVAAVIYNRARHPTWWGTTIKDACLTDRQFSAWNNDNARRNKIGEWTLANPVFAECYRAAIEAIHRDPTEGADHYFAERGPSAIPPPEWAVEARAKGLPEVAIDDHTFMKLREG